MGQRCRGGNRAIITQYAMQNVPVKEISGHTLKNKAKP